MPFNSWFDVAQATLRKPGLQLLANGDPLPGVVDAEIISNSHFAADRFRATLAVSDNAMAWWSAQSDIFLDVQLGLDDVFQSIVQGQVDTVDIDPLRGTVRVEGRDLTAVFIETRTQEMFANRTSSEIVEILATRAGLTANAAPTTTPVGRYYQLEHDAITLNQFSRATTEWDLLIFLAQRENFDLYVTGTTLNFQPRAPEAVVPLLLTPQDLTDLQLQRSLTLARDIEVTVKSWNSRQRNAFTQTARSQASAMNGRSASSGRSQMQSYVYVRPNLTQDAALQFAQNMLAELSRHERLITATMPGELSLTPRSQILLTGTLTDFDQLYYVASIERSISVAHGFTQTIRARNTTVAADTTPPAVEPGVQ